MTAQDQPPAGNAGLIVPLVVWGPTPPPHKVTTIRFLSDRNTIITGADNGHVIIWKCSEDAISPQLLMVGHETAISVISPTSLSPNSTRFISASIDGNLCLWEIQDGRCVDTVASTYVHRHMQPYTYKSSRHTRSTRLFCVGDYSDFVIMDPQDLTVVYNLSSRVEPDWIQAYSIVSRANKPDQCIGLTAAGMVKVWSLVDLDKKDLSNPLYEDESRRLDLRNVKAVHFNPVNERLFLVVTSENWLILDMDDLSCIISARCPSTAVGGMITDVDKVAISFNDQTLRVYQLPLEKLKGPQIAQKFGANPQNYLGNENPFEIALLEGSKGQQITSWLHDAVFAFSCQPAVDSQYQMVRASRDGKILLWRIPVFDGDFMKKFSPATLLPLKYKGTFEQSLNSVWNSLNENEDDAIPVLDPSNVTCSLLIASRGKLILGRKDGLITMAYACEALTRQLLDVSKDKTTVRKLYGHTGAVRCLFYPYEHHHRFDPTILLSGGDDFSVIAWNVQTGSKLHRFSVHGGRILRFLVPPPTCSKQIAKCICVVAEDHSVSLLNIRDNKCCLLASRHPYPVKEVRWRPLDDFMLIRLDDGSVYVWQMETANIDRIIHGLSADEVMTACDEQIGREEGTDEAAASSAVQLMRALKHKNIDAVKQSVTSGSTDTLNRPGTESHTLDVGSPLSVLALPGCSQGAHLVQFEVGSLICGLMNVDANGDFEDENTPNGFSRRLEWQSESGLYVDIARLLLSLLHGWYLDKDLDNVCIKKLGLNRPKHPLYFGNVSRYGQLTVVLPQKQPRTFESYALDVRWQASHSLTTTHLLAVISTSNTLMNMRNVVSSHALRRKSTPHGEHSKEFLASERQQMKQCWSLLAALHCVLLPDHVRPKSSYAAPRIELLARRWQDACIEIRTAAQALLIRELSRLDQIGRRRLIESWAPFLPPLLDPSLSIFGARLQSSVPSLPPNAPPIPPRSKHSPPPMAPVPEPISGEDGESGVQQVRRNQATAIILLGVVGAEFGDELNRADLTRATALSLLELLVAAPSGLLPVHSPLRRAAIDLLGKGFVHWEPHLEISKVLLGLLDLAANSDKQQSQMSVAPPGAPLSPIGDACRTARNALSLIAAARPPALLNALSMEVARYNSAAQHQTIQHTVVSPLLKSRAEVLRIIDELADKKYNEVVERMLPVGEVLVHCLDTSLLKHKTLSDIFPPITRFPMVAYCSSSRRIAFGGYNGNCVVHELRAAKSHNLQSHQGPVTACAFSEDGKYLATYGASDAKINFWQTTQSFLGMGQTQMKLVKTQPAPSAAVATTPTGLSFHPKLVWINAKSLTLMMPGGREQRFTV